MELDRDLRRCAGNEEKANYLGAVGVKRVCKLLEVDAELFEALLTIVVHHAQSATTDKALTADGQHGTNVSIKATADTISSGEDAAKNVAEELTATTIAPYQWFASFATMPRFSFMVRFLTKDLTTAVSQWIEHSGETGCIDLALKYSNGGKEASS